MTQTSGHLIVFSERAGQVWKIRFSRTAVALLILAFLMSFGFVVFVGYTFPPLVTDFEHARLEAENRALRIETTNLMVTTQKLNSRLTTLEAVSGRIANRLNAD